MQADELTTILRSTGLPVYYGRTKELPKAPPYIIFTGAGQNNLPADDTFYWRYDTYQVEYYYKLKNSENEAAIEDILLENGLRYSKSEDVYIEDGEMFVVYYNNVG